MSAMGEEFDLLVARTRRELEARGELRPPKTGPLHLDLPDSVRSALREDLASGAYDRAVKETTGDDPDLNE